ncbi:MAG TPA: phosphate signaling complex protein PhoU [Gemmatimonadaceae bacterium]|nr:phosphate signaling complex protein PhoU [Gemmatimonadaceae bacterium]
MEQSSGHRSFHEKLDLLKQRLLQMSQRAEESLAVAVNAFLERNAGDAKAVLAADNEVDALEVEIEGLAISLLALQQPMARDLRFIVSAIKITGDLERVGDHAVNIAQSANRMADLRALFPAPPEIKEMAVRARNMLSDALDAMVRQDGVLGRDVCRRDDDVDKLHESLFRIMLTHMAEDPATISASLEMLLVSRNLERVADLATNIAEDAVYLAEGKTIKHGLESRAGIVA